MPASPRDIAVVFCSDTRGVLGLAACGRSIVENAQPGISITFYLIHDGIGTATLARLSDSWKVSHVTSGLVPIQFPRDRVDHLITSRTIPHVAYALLLIGDLLPVGLTRCVYCDIDVIFGRDVVELVSTDLDEHVVAAVPDSASDSGSGHFERLGVEGSLYFNSGVLVVDLARWRAQGVGDRAIRVAERVGNRLIMHDQDALNAVLHDQWLVLPEYWNWWRAELPPNETPTVVHMATHPKPWHSLYRGPYLNLFQDHLDRTEFAGSRPPKLTLMGVALAKAKSVVPYWPSVRRRIGAILSGK